MLLVSDGYATEGWRCRSCRYLGPPGPRCPVCANAMDLVDDVVEEAVEEALANSAACRSCGERRPRRARPHRRRAAVLDPCSRPGSQPAVLTAGIDIGGTKLLAVAATEKGEIVAERRRADRGRARRHPRRHRRRGGRPRGRRAGHRRRRRGPARPRRPRRRRALRPQPARLRRRRRPRVARPPSAVPVVVDNDANVAALGEVAPRRGPGPPRGARRHPGDGHRRRARRQRRESTGAGTASPPRSVTSPSTPTARPAPAGPGATGRRSPRGAPSAGGPGSGPRGARRPRCWPGPVASWRPSPVMRWGGGRRRGRRAGHPRRARPGRGPRARRPGQHPRPRDSW